MISLTNVIFNKYLTTNQAVVGILTRPQPNSHVQKEFACIAGETGDIQFECTMFKFFIAEAADRSCKMIDVCRGRKLWTPLLETSGREGHQTEKGGFLDLALNSWRRKVLEGQ